MATSRFKILEFIFLILPYLIIAEDCDLEIKAIVYRKSTKRYEIIQGGYVHHTSTFKDGIPIVDRDKSIYLSDWEGVNQLGNYIQAASEDPFSKLHIIIDYQDPTKAATMFSLPSLKVVKTFPVNITVNSMTYDPQYGFIKIVKGFEQDRYLSLNEKDYQLKSGSVYPSAMTTDGDTKLIVIWSSLSPNKSFQWYDIRTDISWLNLADPPNSAHLRPATHWTGCPQEMCLEGKIDSIIFNSRESHFEIRREYYEYNLDDLSPRGKFIRIDKSSIYTDTSFYVGSFSIAVTAELLHHDGVMFRRDKYFPQLSGKTIQASYTMNDEYFEIYFYLADQHVYKYRKYDNNTYEFLGKQTNPILSGNIDAIYYNQTTQIIYVFKDDYHDSYQMSSDSSDKMKFLGRKSNYVNLWACPKTDPLSKYQLRYFFNTDFLPIYHQLVSTYRLSSFSNNPASITTTTESANADQIKKGWTSVEIVLVVIVAIVVLVLLAVLIYYLRKRIKKNNSNLDLTMTT